jgi:hypothetical protein
VGVVQTLPTQPPLRQSEGPEQVAPTSHRGQGLLPPQSTPVSVPFATPSEQVGARHAVPTQDRPEAQALSSPWVQAARQVPASPQVKLPQPSAEGARQAPTPSQCEDATEVTAVAQLGPAQRVPAS